MKRVKFWFGIFALIAIFPQAYSQATLVLTESIDRSQEVKLPFIRKKYANAANSAGEVITVSQFSFGINSIGVGWTSTGNPSSHDFHIDYRYKDSLNNWTPWKHSHGEISPSESPSNLYWSSLIITDFFKLTNELEVKITPPSSNTIQSVTIDGSYIHDGKINKPFVSGSRSTSCPSQPFIYTRSDWWGTLPADELYYPNATNSKTPSYNTNTTHAFIHHGASSNNYTSGATVVRSYWSFHVNSRGWKDIAYTYLVDKFGNLYKGRYNPDWPNRDELGAHTGVCNPYSFAICCAGDYTSTPLNASMIASINHLLAYKCDLRGMNPVGTGFIYSNTIDIISGHRSAPGASTTCPGNSAFNMLSQIRSGVKAILDSCALGPVPIDNIPPVTSINSSHLWERADFVTPISDVDDSAGTGIKDKLVSVSYYNGDWNANVSNGYFNDQFTQLSPAWTSSVGNWYATPATYLKQDDEVSSNTNLYASLNQNNSDKFLYHWRGTISGTGTNKRAGLHFMCSNPTQTERGDSYMVYFREDNNKIQIYKSVGNTLYIKTDTAYTFTAGVEYDFKVLYTKSTGTIDVYVNNQLEDQFIDPWPLSTGDFVSFRTGNCIYEIDRLEVYKERANSVNVTVGLGSKDIPVQNMSPLQPAGQIKSIAIDSIGNMSTIQEKYVNVDWTRPDPIYINDGFTQGVDVDTIYRNDKIDGNWQGKDDNSGIKKYYFGVGNAPGLTNIMPFTDIGAITQYTANSTLNYGVTYYVSIQIFNGAGLDTIMTSDGQYLKQETSPASVNELTKAISETKLFPNPSSDAFNVSFVAANNQLGELTLIDSKGATVYSQSLQIREGKNQFLITPQVAKGYYFVKLTLNQSQVLLGIQGVE